MESEVPVVENVEQMVHRYITTVIIPGAVAKLQSEKMRESEEIKRKLMSDMEEEEDKMADDIVADVINSQMQIIKDEENELKQTNADAKWERVDTKPLTEADVLGQAPNAIPVKSPFFSRVLNRLFPSRQAKKQAAKGKKQAAKAIKQAAKIQKQDAKAKKQAAKAQKKAAKSMKQDAKGRKLDVADADKQAVDEDKIKNRGSSAIKPSKKISLFACCFGLNKVDQADY